jgi:hypothetical protein
VATSSSRSVSAVCGKGEGVEGTGPRRRDCGAFCAERHLLWQFTYIALQPLFVEATRQPSVVAIGM